jgi:hypothetical protein
MQMQLGISCFFYFISLPLCWVCTDYQLLVLCWSSAHALLLVRGAELHSHFFQRNLIVRMPFQTVWFSSKIWPSLLWRDQRLSGAQADFRFDLRLDRETRRLDLVLPAQTSQDAKGILGPFDCADKPTEKHCWPIYCEKKILFRLKKQAGKDGL